MGLNENLISRSKNICEICGSKNLLSSFEVNENSTNIDENILVCDICKNELDSKTISNPNHFRVLSDTMWSQTPAVQVVAYRILFKLSKENYWARDLLEMLYLDDELLSWAKQGCIEESTTTQAITKDSNGNQLLNGDSVTIIKDLDVKGANFTAKRGTIVKNIFLTSNPEQIEGKVNGTQIVLLSCFLKKVQE